MRHLLWRPLSHIIPLDQGVCLCVAFAPLSRSIRESLVGCFFITIPFVQGALWEPLSRIIPLDQGECLCVAFAP